MTDRDPSQAAARLSSLVRPPPGRRIGAGEDRRRAAQLLLRREARARRHLHEDPRQPGHRLHRAVGLRQVHVPAHAQPDERHHPGRARRGQGAASTATTSTPRGRRRVAAAPGRHGVPEVEPVSRSRSSRTSPTGCASTAWRAARRNWPSSVEESLRQAALWDEVKDRLHDSALALSGGQQQRLCIARALAVRPEILLMDEPASALDPIATQRIEELIYDLKKTYTIVIVTHNMQQAARVSDSHGVLLARAAGGVRTHRPDLHGAGREADRRLRHGTVRLREHRWNASFDTSRKNWTR